MSKGVLGAIGAWEDFENLDEVIAEIYWDRAPVALCPQTTTPLHVKGRRHKELRSAKPGDMLAH